MSGLSPPNRGKPQLAELDQESFRLWEKRMGFDQHGRQQEEADALGTSTARIRRLRNGTGDYTRELALAMSALAMNLPPWPITVREEGDTAPKRRGKRSIF